MSLFAVCDFAVANVDQTHRNNGSEAATQENDMNWILETYSDVYSTAMMHDVKARHHAPATRKSKTIAKIARLFHRG